MLAGDVLPAPELEGDVRMAIERTPSQRGRYARTKGHNFERQLVHRFREVMPGAEVKRGLQSRGGGAEVPDVDCPVFHVEAKVGKQPNPRAALKQAFADAAKGKIPVAIIKDDREVPFVLLGLEDFLDFVGEWWVARQK